MPSLASPSCSHSWTNSHCRLAWTVSRPAEKPGSRRRTFATQASPEVGQGDPRSQYQARMIVTTHIGAAARLPPAGRVTGGSGVDASVCF
jgi:hypothetical protein